ncbi:MAG TPA: choline-sulfatase [Ardenticatenaceae bacterium]|nr:choline-sulfatase [Ardenticatenaceae bacterium]
MNTRRPNILLVMADQMAAPALPSYGHPVVQAPNLSALAAGGVVFESAYCNSPLCAPSRASLMTGQLPSRIGAFDNAAEFPPSVPTLAHYLRELGYQTCLVGKMHFVGPDQLHGFEERLTTDIYPADFGWTPDWEQPEQRASWYHNMLSVVQAGTAITTNQLDFDEEVAFQAVRKLYALARAADERPFCMVVSFTHPHDPFAITPEYWERYDHRAIDLPAIPPIPVDQLEPHSRRIYEACGLWEYEQTEERVLKARHAYYSMIGYVDDKVGQLLRALDATGFREDTIVAFTSDHGEMLGERGLWYKMLFFEWSARVPLIFNAPGRFTSRRVARPVSLVDLLPTLVELAANESPAAFATELDGHSLVPLLHGDDSGAAEPVLAEYLAEGAAAPCLMLRRGRYKYIYSEPDPDQLYDLAADPHELENLAGRPEHEALRQELEAEVLRRWDPRALRAEVIASQRRRRLVYSALMQGAYTPWDFQPFQPASQQYMRNHLDLNDLERRARFPSPEVPRPDFPRADELVPSGSSSPI